MNFYLPLRITINKIAECVNSNKCSVYLSEIGIINYVFGFILKVQ